MRIREHQIKVAQDYFPIKEYGLIQKWKWCWFHHSVNTSNQICINCYGGNWKISKHLLKISQQHQHVLKKYRNEWMNKRQEERWCNICVYEFSHSEYGYPIKYFVYCILYIFKFIQFIYIYCTRFLLLIFTDWLPNIITSQLQPMNYCNN